MLNNQVQRTLTNQHLLQSCRSEPIPGIAQLVKIDLSISPQLMTIGPLSLGQAGKRENMSNFIQYVLLTT